ncbi:cytochrome P450 [Coprinopsis sp. MPI-PUGE-AT-0042]|nr:cytochrome P450 [Coprinopsis sp. MPI-PUGE-AT-0042]
MISTHYLYFSLLLFLGSIFCFWRRGPSTLPPGPKGSFLQGAASLLPRLEPWKTYAAWGLRYKSSIISFRVYNRRIMVLNSPEARQDIYSERPMSWMYNVICDRGKSVFNINSSHSRHRQYRKLIQNGLGSRGIRQYIPLIQMESKNLSAALVREPQGLVRHVQRNSVSVTEEASKISGWALQPGRWLVDYLPDPYFGLFPAWAPGAAWKRQGLEWRDRLRHLADVPHAWAKRQMEASTAEESFTSTLLHPENNGTSSLGEDDLPSSSDLHQLVYLGAVMKEVFRYAPVANLALPHRVSMDDTYDGFFIPKDSTVIGNVWAILHNEAIYPDPFAFTPERFLPVQGIEPQPDPKRWAFGFGRVFFAETTILYAMCSILKTCQISLPEGTPQPTSSYNVPSHIKPFPLQVCPLMSKA